MLGRVVSLPLDLLAALRSVPGIARDTNRMAEHTEVLEEVARATEALPELREQMARVAEATAAIGAMDDKMATIAEAMPVLVEVQRHLAKLPETIERLDGRITELSVLLQGLQESLEPVGRIARRLPGQRNHDR
jgi:citrate synthase